MDSQVFTRLFSVQGILWLVALPLLGLSLFLARQAALGYLRLTTVSGSVEPVRWLGIRPGENWRRQGWQLLAVITAVTGAVIFLQMNLKPVGLGRLIPVIPVILLLALSNSLAEELIFRHSVVSLLDATLWRSRAPLISGALFGVAHYFGVPSGFPGVLMAGFLGWLLAKSMQETGGIFWAWLIHFVQDVVIISAMFLSEASR